MRFEDATDGAAAPASSANGNSLPGVPPFPAAGAPLNLDGMSPDAKLDYIMMNMTTKVELLALESKIATLVDKIMKLTQQMIDTAIGPLKAELGRLNAKIQMLEKQGVSTSKSGFDPADPALKRIEFRGFADSTSHNDRMTEIETLLRGFPGIRFTDIGSIYKGPYGNRTLLQLNNAPAGGHPSAH